MQNNTQEYLKGLIEDLEIQLNTAEGEIREAMQTKRKLQKFVKKISKND